MARKKATNVAFLWNRVEVDVFRFEKPTETAAPAAWAASAQREGFQSWNRVECAAV